MSTQRQKLEQKLLKPQQRSKAKQISKSLLLAQVAETEAIQLAQDVQILGEWLQQDVLSLAGPTLATRQTLYDFIVAQLQQREIECPHRITSVRCALQNQRHELLAFAEVLEKKLHAIAQEFEIPSAWVEQLCQLQAYNPETSIYWQLAAQLHTRLQGRFFLLQQAVTQALQHTHIAISAVENLNGRLRNYFNLRRHVGNEYLELLRFFLNHRTFLRSDVPQRVGKSPAELLTGLKHPHWLELLGFQRFVRA